MALHRGILYSLLASVPLAIASGLAGFEDYKPERSDFCKAADAESRPVPTLPFTIQIEGRRATLSFPKHYKDTEASSLIVAFHDTNQTVKEFRKVSQLSDPGVNDFAIVVYPHAMKDGWISEPQNRNESLQSSIYGPSQDPNNDVFWTGKLVDHMKKSYCIDTRKIYAVGQGTGGGVVQVLSCQRATSRRFAAFAGVNSALLKPEGKEDPGPWGFCDVGRRPQPVLEIHGDSNKLYPHHPSKKQPGLKFQDWLAMWSMLNACGQHIGATLPSTWSDATYLTRLKDGQMSEGIVHAGGATRVSFRCTGWPADKYDESGQLKKNDDTTRRAGDTDHDELEDGPEIDENSRIPSPPEEWVPENDSTDEGTTILHYILRNVGHGWPRQELDKDEEIVVNGIEVHPPGVAHFDATTTILDWLQSHNLPSPQRMTRMARYLLLERGGARQSEEPPKLPPGPPPKREQQSDKMVKAQMKVEVKDEHWVKQPDGTYKLDIPVEELHEMMGHRPPHDEL